MNTFIFRNEYILQTSSKAPTHNGAYTQFRRFGSTCNGEATETCNPAYSSVWMKTPHKRVLTKNIPHQRYLSSFLIVVCIFFHFYTLFVSAELQSIPPLPVVACFVFWLLFVSIVVYSVLTIFIVLSVLDIYYVIVCTLSMVRIVRIFRIWLLGRCLLVCDVVENL